MPPGMAQNLDAFIAKWAAVGAAERPTRTCSCRAMRRAGRGAAQPCDGDAERDTYVFEREARLAHEGGETTIGASTCTSRVLHPGGQAGVGRGSSKLGKAKRGTPAWNI